MTYRGVQIQSNTKQYRVPKYTVFAKDKPLSSVLVHSKNQFGEFAWGYHGVYPLNLAVSIIMDLLEMDSYDKFVSMPNSMPLLYAFYDEIICSIKTKNWEMTDAQLISYLQAKQEEYDA